MAVYKIKNKPFAQNLYLTDLESPIQGLYFN